jgi:hypothetical protein
MLHDDDREDDPERDRRQWNAYLDLIDAEIAEEKGAAASISKTPPALPSPFVVDVGSYTSRADRDAIQAEQDRWTRLEKLGR